MVLVRHLLGGVLRRQRLRQGLTLREVSVDARVSLGYISEVERGQKEASSELLAAICAALEVPLSDVLREVSDEIDKAETRVLAPSVARPTITKVSSQHIEGNGIDRRRIEIDKTRIDKARIEKARIEKARVESARSEAARIESARIESARIESARLDGGPVEAENAGREVVAA